ncbi:ABC transporter substrate-binding protein [Kitasatospora sp. NPDC052896]|uniref:ABC transporter substrate-binding protein n=1 Tax=Kitasatospora sp. NPDC052896 TaxID=3364061 RepID=UPI0037C9F838
MVLSGVLTGCGGPATTGDAARSTTPAAPGDGGYPVTVTNCGTRITFTKAPTRAVSNDINTTEDMLALGLESHMVGDFGVNGDGPDGKPVPQQYQTAFRTVPSISPSYFTLEPLVGLHPDFLFAGWNYGLHTGTDLTPDGLAKFGIKTLALTESCAHVQSGTGSVSIDDTYRDLTNLGQIFGTQTRARQLVDSMKAEVTAAQAKTTGLAPVRVFDYDSGQSAPFTAGGLAMPDALIRLGGGTNVFAGLEQSWTSVSWEQVAAADPQCIVINDYGTPTAEQKQQFLESSPITRNLTAVRNHCFLTLSYDQVTPGPRNAEAVTAIARWLHPDAFGLPTDGA